MAQIIKPEPVDQASISIIMDNSIDVLLASTILPSDFHSVQIHLKPHLWLNMVSQS